MKAPPSYRPGQTIRPIFPAISSCPRCAGHRWRFLSNSRGRSIQYRECRACGERFKVSPVGREVVAPNGQFSLIIPLV